MAERTHGFSWSAALIGAAATLLLIVLVAAIVVFGGFYNVAAKDGHGLLGPVFEATMHNAVKRSADGLEPPKLTQAEVIEGGGHYKAMCQQCHGAPGVKRQDFATALTPRPPEITHAAKEWSQSEIFWIAKHGIQMTAMPAFGEYEGDSELWKIAAFVEQLPSMSAAEYAAIPEGHGHGGGGHEASGGQQSSGQQSSGQKASGQQSSSEQSGGHPHPGGGH